MPPAVSANHHLKQTELVPVCSLSVDRSISDMMSL